MDLDQFLSAYPSVLFSSDGDSVFSYLRLETNGMSSPKEAKLINYASSLLSENEIYVEIGSYMGFTICASGYERGHICIAIDNFTESYSQDITTQRQVREVLIDNMKKYVKNGLVFPKDFREFQMNDLMKPGYKIGVLYIDGKHDEADVVESINKMQPALADQAVVIFDDTNIGGVRDGIKKILQDARFEEVFYAKSHYNAGVFGGLVNDPYLHNGFSVVTYRGKN